jgi:hypothetical protein
MRFLTSLLVIDLPVLAAVAIAGTVYGYADTLTAVMAYREHNLWTWLPSLLLLLALVRRRRA